MRPIISGLLATALYTVMIAGLLQMAMPSRARVQAFIDASRPLPAESSALPIDNSLAG